MSGRLRRSGGGGLALVGSVNAGEGAGVGGRSDGMGGRWCTPGGERLPDEEVVEGGRLWKPRPARLISRGKLEDA